MHEKGVWEGRGSEAEEVIGVQVNLDRERWTGRKKCSGGEEAHKECWGGRPEAFGSGREHFLRSSPREGVENAARSGLG